MSEERISRVAAEFVVKGDVISKGGTVFVYEVVKADTTDSYTTFTLRELVKIRPITARWKVPSGQMVNIHNRTPQPQGRVKRDPSKRGSPGFPLGEAPMDLRSRVKAAGDAVAPPDAKAISAKLSEMVRGTPVAALPDEPIIVALDPNDFPSKR